MPRWQVGPESAGGVPLTEREVEVLRYLALRWDKHSIAEELDLSPHMVRNHATNLRRKLDVRSSLEAFIATVRLGVLTFASSGPKTCGV